MNLEKALPQSIKAVPITTQMARCATAGATNYRACWRSRSRAEFIARIGVVEGETDESAF